MTAYLAPINYADEAESERRSARKLYRNARKHDRATYGSRERHVELAARYRAWARDANARARRYDQMGESR